MRRFEPIDIYFLKLRLIFLSVSSSQSQMWSQIFLQVIVTTAASKVDYVCLSVCLSVHNISISVIYLKRAVHNIWKIYFLNPRTLFTFQVRMKKCSWTRKIYHIYCFLFFYIFWYNNLSKHCWEKYNKKQKRVVEIIMINFVL